MVESSDHNNQLFKQALNLLYRPITITGHKNKLLTGHPDHTAFFLDGNATADKRVVWVMFPTERGTVTLINSKHGNRFMNDEFELQEHFDGGYCLKSAKEGKYLNTRLNNAQCIEAG